MNGHFLHFSHPNSFMAPKVYQYYQMLKMTHLNKNDLVLDLGCGDGSLTLAIAEHVAKAIDVDPNPHTREQANFYAMNKALI
jgi:SAM-dependent methyltransferases related to tRNA (uracil-5-)-methyltransferase